MTTDTQAALDFTIGRVTNEDLEAAVEVHFKHEDEVDGEAIGPVFVVIAGGAKCRDCKDGEIHTTSSDHPFRGPSKFVALRANPDEAEWHTASLAKSLAEALDLPLTSI